MSSLKILFEIFEKESNTNININFINYYED